MALPAQQLKTQLVDKVIALLHARVPEGTRAALMERFVRSFFANVAPADIVSAGPEQLYGMALALWQFAQVRKPNTPKVRLYSPQIDQHGWQTGRTVVEVINDDMPFLVDSVTAALNQRGMATHLVIHPVFKVRRDAEGRLIDLPEMDSDDRDLLSESAMHVTVNRQTSPDKVEDTQADLRNVLADVRAAVEDWRTMRAKAAEIAASLRTHAPADRGEEAEEAAAFLDWLDDDHLTFLGYRFYRLRTAGQNGGGATYEGVAPDSGLGVLRDASLILFDGLRDLESLPSEIRHFVQRPDVLRVMKANRRATVHRPVHLDAIFVKAYDEQGRHCGDHLIAGLFTSTAYNRLAREIPFLRKKVSRIVDRAGFSPQSHDAKTLNHVFETLPRDELFQAAEDELFETGLGILHLQERQKIALFVRRDPFRRFVSLLLFVPRDRYDTALRRKYQSIIERSLGGTTAAFYIQVAESSLARLHFIIKTDPDALVEYDVREIEARLEDAARNWNDVLRDALFETHGEEVGLRLLGRYATAFPPGYSESFGAETGVFDIGMIEKAYETGRLVINLYRPLEAEENELRFKIYARGKPIPLSDVLPVLEHMDLRVITELPFEVLPSDLDETVWIHDFSTATHPDVVVDAVAIKDAFQDAFLKVWYGEAEDDGFNRLVMRAGLSARQVAILRAQAKYLRQAGLPFSLDYVADTLAGQPLIARLIVQLFCVRFDPNGEAGRAEAAAELEATIQKAVEDVRSLDEDRILRRFLNLTQATLRTNYFQRREDGQPKAYISFKLDSRVVDELPLPRPMVEIYVHSPRVEAIHLRGGKVARGGIRWSDRREDFRTEILGLMKAQMVKNPVIVPVGSKGGFVVKRPPPASAGREAVLTEGIECYKTMMRGMLDLTDNLTPDGAVIPPKDVVRQDGDDPYLVVAADKGTATFSDIANGVAREYGFWLDDAFASGGSAGYDHKGMGITARGAWEAVKRHFRELGIDCQSEDFTCVGIGDMSGDVFGNGMLLSQHTRLVGAFNHLHIFCDPNPDAAASHAERKRLFDLPRSTWADYNTELISKGGGVFSRSAKSIDLSPEIRERFGIRDERITPARLVQAMLKAPVDLLYFGGIGTYVKSTEETHADAGDKLNDWLRVDAAKLRCRIVGEGANLGMTQKGRIEAAQKGVRLNTDAIDNSAGVDTSDHEVNIKIMLGDVMARGDMTEKQRNQTLADMTEEVAALVLVDNYQQTQAISVAQAGGHGLFEQQVAFMRALEKAGKLSRTVEELPDDEELASRAATKTGLTRPELSVILAYAKITLFDDLCATDLPDDPTVADELVQYFPAPLRERFAMPIARHRLRREIIATAITNGLINRAGLTFVRDMAENTSMPADAIARAYMIVRDAFNLQPLWTAIEALDNKVPAACQHAMLGETIGLLYRTVAWFLSQGRQPLDVAAEIAMHRPGVEALAQALETVLAPDTLEAHRKEADTYKGQGVPEDLAMHVATLGILSQAVDINQIAHTTGRLAPSVAAVYFALGHRFGMGFLRDRAERMSIETPWQKQAVGAIMDDLFAHQSQMTLRVLSEAPDTTDADACIDGWVTGRRALADRLTGLLAEFRAAPSVDLAMLAVANRQIRGLFAG